MLIQTLKRFLTKANFDYEDPNIDLYKFHPQLQIFLVFNGIFFNNRDSFLRYIWPITSGLLTIIACIFQIIFIYHGYAIKDYSFATECFSYFIIMSTVPIVYGSVLLNRTKMLNFLKNMNMDFVNICSLGPKYKDSFLRGQLLIWTMCALWFLFNLCIVTTYVSSTLGQLLYQSLFATQNEHIVRPLMFPMWLPEDDPYRTPNYEIFFFFELLYMVITPLAFGDLEVLFDGLDETVAMLPRYNSRRIEVQMTLNGRIRRIVEWHVAVIKSVEDVSSIYGPPLVYQVMVSSIAICLMAYQVAESIDHGKLDLRFTLLCIGACVQLWIPCYLGTLIRNKAFSIGDACWNSGWHETSLSGLIRQDIIILIMRCQQPLSIKFTGLPKLELETFSSIMSTAYSYFNLLRQYK